MIDPGLSDETSKKSTSQHLKTCVGVSVFVSPDFNKMNSCPQNLKTFNLESFFRPEGCFN